MFLTYRLLDGKDTVDACHIDAAAAFWDYSRASAQLIFGDRLGDADADRLYAALVKARPAGLDRTAQYAVFDNNIGKAKLERLRQPLEDDGRAVEMCERTGGRQRLVLVATQLTNYE